jgi:hypothetical protein
VSFKPLGFLGKFTYSEWLIMRFSAQPEIALFITKAMPHLAHTQLSLQLGAYPGCKNDQDFGAAHLP